MGRVREARGRGRGGGRRGTRSTGEVDEAARMFLSDDVSSSRHDFTPASRFAHMTSPMHKEPMPCSISHASCLPPSSRHRNLQRRPKLFLGFDKSCSVYYYTWYRGEKPKSLPPKKKLLSMIQSCIIHHRGRDAPGRRCWAGELFAHCELSLVHWIGVLVVSFYKVFIFFSEKNLFSFQIILFT